MKCTHVNCGRDSDTESLNDEYRPQIHLCFIHFEEFKNMSGDLIKRLYGDKLK